jgi:hypothetical protein
VGFEFLLIGLDLEKMRQEDAEAAEQEKKRAVEYLEKEVQEKEQRIMELQIQLARKQKEIELNKMNFMKTVKHYQDVQRNLQTINALYKYSCVRWWLLI